MFVTIEHTRCLNDNKAYVGCFYNLTSSEKNHSRVR